MSVSLNEVIDFYLVFINEHSEHIGLVSLNIKALRALNDFDNFNVTLF